MKKKKWLVMVMLVLVCSLMFGTTVCAAGTGDVAGAIEGTWKDASAQIKTVVNKVVFPAIDLILAVFFFAKLGTAYFDYRKHGQFEWALRSRAIIGLYIYPDRTCLYLDNSWNVGKGKLPKKEGYP